MVVGATRVEALVWVVLPAVGTAMTVTALFALMGAWNEFVLAATSLAREDTYT
jgi:arabinogalactan oligomer/maltooligosaccharide transport system permease protein